MLMEAGMGERWFMVQMPQGDDPEAFVSDTRQRLLVAAVRVFAEKGFDGAGIREIAQRAKANSALVHYYFGGKEGLYRAALSFLFDRKGQAVRSLEAPPEPGSVEAAQKAALCLKRYIRMFLGELLTWNGNKAVQDPGAGACGIDCGSSEFRAAAHVFWTRELLDQDQERSRLVMDHIRPYVEYLGVCLRGIRPDLGEDARFLMGCSIQAQILFFHRDEAMLTRLRGRPYDDSDIDLLSEHISAFSFRGLGISF